MSENAVPYTTKQTPAPVELTSNVVRKFICPTATEQEIYFFLQLCKAQQLNPFLREVYLIKYGSSPATIVTGKETFTKRASRIESYAGFKAGLIVLGDCAEPVYREGSFYIKDKEHLAGGWAEVYRAGLSVPVRAEVSFEEYVQRKTDGSPNRFWAEKPATMIRKVAIVQALREAFPEEFGGLYSPEEMAVHVDKLPEYDMSTPVSQKEATQEPQRVRGAKKAEPSPEAGPTAEGESAKNTLHNELAEYCQMTDGEIDMDMYRRLLAEVSRFEGRDKKGTARTYEMTDVYSENVSEKWAQSALKKLRHRLSKDDGNGENGNG
jgi:phage recombination protein Bet